MLTVTETDAFGLPKSFRGREDWITQAGSQQLFLSCTVPEILYEGTRGPGKTDAILMKFAKYCGLGFGSEWRGIIFRETYKQMTDLIKRSKRRFYASIPGITFNGGSYTWRWPTGEELLFSYMRTADDYWNYHGHEYPFIAWEELTNWLTLECYDLMKMCNRSSFPGMPRFNVSSCNPFGKGHSEVKRYYIDPAPRGTIIRDAISPEGRVAIHGNILENKALLEADPSYLSKLDAIRDPNRRKAWRFGSWNIVIGTMFDHLWASDIHVVKAFSIPKHWPVECSFDWGSTAPFSVGWWARPDGTAVEMANGIKRVFPRGSYLRIGEWYGWSKEPNKGLRMLASNIAEGIHVREKRMGIAQQVRDRVAGGDIFGAQDGHSIDSSFKDSRIVWQPAWNAPGSRVQGWERIGELLQGALDNEGPGLWVFDTCDEGFIRTVPVLPRDVLNPDDVDSASEDHAGDEARYEVCRKPLVATQQNMH